MQIPEKTDAVGVVAEYGAVLLHRQRVHRSTAFRARASYLGKLTSRFLQRYGAVESHATVKKKGAGLPLKGGSLHILSEVDEMLTGLFREQGMDTRRLGVADRVSEDCIAVWFVAHHDLRIW